MVEIQFYFIPVLVGSANPEIVLVGLTRSLLIVRQNESSNFLKFQSITITALLRRLDPPLWSFTTLPNLIVQRVFKGTEYSNLSNYYKDSLSFYQGTTHICFKLARSSGPTVIHVGPGDPSPYRRLWCKSRDRFSV